LKKLFLRFVFAALVASSVASSSAAVLLSDSFDYPDGPLVPYWTHHSPTGSTGEVQVIAGKVFLSQTNLEDVSAGLTGQPYAPTTNIGLYASFTIRYTSLPAGQGSYFAHFKSSSTTGFGGKVYATTNGVPAGFFRVGIANVDNTVPSVLITSNLSLNVDYPLVLRFYPSNAVATLWLNPNAETDSSVTATDAPSLITVSTFALRESFSSPNGMGSLFFDNLVIGTQFSDVVADTAPIINVGPTNQAVMEGSDALFTVSASGATPLSYQWDFEGAPISDATNSALTLQAVATNQAGAYSVTLSNALGVITSGDAILTIVPTSGPPVIATQPIGQAVVEGASVTFSVEAFGAKPLAYQWQFNGANLATATTSILNLSTVTTNQAGAYSVVITNGSGAVTSDVAILVVNQAIIPALPSLTYLTYNMKGNGAATWSTNSAQVQAIGHEVMYLNPDIITFNEVPNTFTYEMTNFITAFLPGYYLVTNSATDGFIRSAIASRFPILSSKSYLHSADLNPYGYTNSDFTRDLFTARIAVPAFPQPLHVFVVHLKSGQDTDSSNKRSAETRAVSNFFVNVFLPTNAVQPYVLSGDMNEDVDNPPSSNPQSIQHLINPQTGLYLTTPLNPFTGTNLTFSIQATGGLTKRYDYIMPCSLLLSNISGSQVFRTDLLSNSPPPLLTTDDKTASDHLPVFMTFSNPFDKPFRLTSLQRTGSAISLQWQSIQGQPYRIDASSNLVSWFPFASNLTATGSTFSFVTNNLNQSLQFFRVVRTL
jgi:endonuclease/exonuclease/phosphatase family metal-dependent hydrolase